MYIYIISYPKIYIHTRVKQMSESRQGEQLWDTAVSPMAVGPTRTSSLYEQRGPRCQWWRCCAHCKPWKTSSVPWLLQLSHREDVWEMMTDLCNCTVWTLLGMSRKQHSQTMSKPAQLLQQALGKGGQLPQKGKGKAASKQRSWGGRCCNWWWRTPVRCVMG